MVLRDLLANKQHKDLRGDREGGVTVIRVAEKKGSRSVGTR